jgi:hypothetical protein
VDGARRLETRRRSVAGRGTPRPGATTAPNLNSRMLRPGPAARAQLEFADVASGAGGARAPNLNSRMSAAWRRRDVGQRKGHFPKM